MPIPNRTGRDMFTLHSTIASIMIYVECLVIAGRDFDEAKRIAITSTTWVGEAAQFRRQIIKAVMGATLNDLRPAAQEVIRQTAYFMVLSETGKRDNVFRRCVFMWFGLLL